MTRYHIVTNGLKFRIRWERDRRFLWFRWVERGFVHRFHPFGSHVAEEGTYEGAERAIAHLRAVEKAKAHGWRPADKEVVGT
jgi:hypothetical protein